MTRFIFGVLLLLTACQNQNQTDSIPISFKQVNWYAQRAAAAYQSETSIRKAFPNTLSVVTSAQGEVQYFLEMDHQQKRQIISIRGTDNLRNIRDDVTYIESRNPKLGIFVHSGFDRDTQQIFQAIQPNLNKNYTTIVTGHSLGAAISTLLMMYLHEEGFPLGPSINFGQPKVTNQAGARKYHDLPLLRVADENDLVPLLPPTDLVDSIHGAYEHLGPELILLAGEYYSFQTHHQVRTHEVNSFWDNLGDESVSEHFMKNYLHNIRSKLDQSKAVPYEQREHYIPN